MIRIMPPLRHNAGFTLVEMAMVLVITSVVVGGGLSIATSKMEREKIETTIRHLDQLDNAIADYRKAYNRLPCPADGTVNPDDATYGIEAAVPGACTGSTPAANFVNAQHATKDGNPATTVVGGTAPVVTLGLPREVGMDGWGNKISYHIDARATEFNAFSTYTISNSNCFNVIIDDERTWAADTDRNYLSFHAVYAMISHGKDGHGAFSIGGPRVSSGTTNLFQQQNANLDDTGAVTAYNNLFHLISEREDPDTYTNKFDDVIRFKTRSQLRSAQDGPGIVFPDLIVSSENSGTSEYGTNFYYRCGDTFLLEAKEMNDINNKQVNRISISPNNAYILGSTDSDYHFRMWTYDGIKTHQLPDSSFIPFINNPAGTAQNAIWADDGSYFLISAFDDLSGDDRNRVGIYEKTDVNEFTLIDSAVENADNQTGNAAKNVLEEGAMWGLNLSPDGNELILNYAGGVLMKPMLYKRNADNTFTHVPDAIPEMPVESNNRPMWSPDGNYLLFRKFFSAGVWLFRNDGNNHYSKIPDPTPVLASTIGSPAFSPDSRFLVLPRSTGNQIYVYEMTTNGQYVEMPTQPTQTPERNNFVQFSPDGKYLAVGKNYASGNPTLYIYKVEGRTFTLLTSPDGPIETPKGNVNWIEWRRPMPWEQKK